jgi:transcription antitermination factor NusG
MLNWSDVRIGDVVGYVEKYKPPTIEIEGRPLLTLVVEAEANRASTAIASIVELGLKPYYPVLHKQIPAGRRRAREVEVAIFPGRIFVPMPLTNAAWSLVRFSRGVHDFMKIDGVKPAVISDADMEEIRKTEAKLDAKYRRKLAAAEASPYYKGRQVWAEILPAQKLLATIEDLDAKGRINVLLDVAILGRMVWPVKPHLLQFVDA